MSGISNSFSKINILIKYQANDMLILENVWSYFLFVFGTAGRTPK